MRFIFILVLLISTSIDAYPRSRAQRAEFQRLHPCPSTNDQRGACPGWIVDHIVPLACGGLDDPANMQWQTVQDAKAKDKWEMGNCRIRPQE